MHLSNSQFFSTNYPDVVLIQIQNYRYITSGSVTIHFLISVLYTVLTIYSIHRLVCAALHCTLYKQVSTFKTNTDQRECLEPQKCTTQYHVQLGLPYKSRAIKGLVGCWVLFYPIRQMFGHKRLVIIGCVSWKAAYEAIDEVCILTVSFLTFLRTLSSLIII